MKVEESIPNNMFVCSYKTKNKFRSANANITKAIQEMFRTNSPIIKNVSYLVLQDVRKQHRRPLGTPPQRFLRQLDRIAHSQQGDDCC